MQKNKKTKKKCFTTKRWESMVCVYVHFLPNLFVHMRMHSYLYVRICWLVWTVHLEMTNCVWFGAYRYDANSRWSHPKIRALPCEKPRPKKKWPKQMNIVCSPIEELTRAHMFACFFFFFFPLFCLGEYLWGQIQTRPTQTKTSLCIHIFSTRDIRMKQKQGFH